MSRGGHTDKEVAKLTPAEMRAIIRRGEWDEPDEMSCLGFWKANVIILPKDWATDFQIYAQRNPQACRIAASTEVGDPSPKLIAKDADIRTDLPKYRVFKNGECIEEPTDIKKYWRDDLVTFFVGPFVNTVWLLQKANVRFRLLGIWTSKLPCIPGGRFTGNFALSCTIFKTTQDAVRGVQIASRMLDGHGPPIHIGDPGPVGIKEGSKPDILDMKDVASVQHPEMVGKGGYTPGPGEVRMWWGVGVTPQLAAKSSKIPFMITHWPACVFISDTRIGEWPVI